MSLATSVNQAFATLEAGGGAAYMVLELQCKAGEVDLREEASAPVCSLLQRQNTQTSNKAQGHFALLRTSVELGAFLLPRLFFD